MAKEVKETSKDEPKKQLTWKENLIAQVKEFVIVFGGFILLNNFIIASFLVPTGSMENEVLTGDFLMVNKFLYGPSTPRNIMFTDIRLPWTTLPGFKDVERGDVIVFEFPGMRDEVKPEAFTFYLKRCMAIGGDTLELRNRVVYINGQPAPIPKNMRFDHLQILPPSFQDERSFPPTAMYNEDNYGPIVIPKKGMIITVTPENYRRWEIFIQRDGHLPELRNDGTITIDGKPTNTYVVEKDYVFGMGDHRDNSLDSRFWGFIPRENIVGTPMFVYFSVMLTDEYRAELAMKGETMRMEWIYTTFSGRNILLDIVAKLFITLFNPETIRFGRIGTVIG
ncbi:MAG: signal peptidase I [Bacteroidetes bacterium]|nr:signal peptidase I [Bacteroidota bacterium]